MIKYSQSVFYAAVVSVGGLLFGFDASVISGVLRDVVPLYNLTDWQVGLLVGAPTLAGIFSSIAAGPMADIVGRKKVLIFLIALYTLSAICSALATSYEMLVVARFVGGLAFATLGIAPMYIAEISPQEKRGQLVSFNQFNIVIGFSLAYFSNYFILQASQSQESWIAAVGIDEAAWRWMLGVEAIPAALCLIMLFAIPESPRWLALRGHNDRARAVLKKLFSDDLVERSLREIKQSLAGAHPHFSVRVRQLFSPSMKLVLGIGLVIGVLQQVTGVNAIYFYAPTIFEQSGVGTNAAFAQATLIGIINVIVTIVAMVLMDRVGRKPLLMVGLIGVIVSNALVGYGFSQATFVLTADTLATLGELMDVDPLLPLVNQVFVSDMAFKDAVTGVLDAGVYREHQAVLIQHAISMNATLVLVGVLGFVASFALSLGPVMWVLFSEIFPNRVRGLASAFVGFFNAIASFTVQLVFPWQLTHMGSSMTFFLYSGLGVVGLIVMAILLPETKGKSLEQIEAAYARGSTG